MGGVRYCGMCEIYSCEIHMCEDLAESNTYLFQWPHLISLWAPIARS